MIQHGQHKKDIFFTNGKFLNISRLFSTDFMLKLLLNSFCEDIVMKSNKQQNKKPKDNHPKIESFDHGQLSARTHGHMCK